MEDKEQTIDDQSMADEEGNTHSEFDAILERLKMRTNISDITYALKDEILENINHKIDAYQKRKNRFRRLAATITSMAAMLAIMLFVGIDGKKTFHKNLASTLEMINTLEETKEVSIISGQKKQEIAERKKITQTKEGNLLIAEQKEIVASDIETEYISIIVPKGKRSSVEFSDGSQAWINSGTKIVFPKNFEKNERTIYVDGEIYIDVEKDEKRPFHVHTENMEIVVLGTCFNVNAYKEETSNMVVLVEGSVEINSNKQKNRLKPGQAYFAETNNISIKTVDTSSYTAWKDGRLRLQNEPFKRLLKRLSRYYGVEIVTGENLKDHRFEGNLDLKESIEEILKTLSNSKKFTYSRNGNKIEVKN